MAENNKPTIYQGLNKLLNLDGFGFENQISQALDNNINTNNNIQQPKIIIKGDSPQEIHRKGLELQQKEVLKQKFFKSSERGFQKALQYEAARLPAYMDYEGMEYYPLIASALDLFMEESTTIGIDGKMLNIYSNKERIKAHLEELFYDIMSVNINLPFWVRNTAKYGDNFVNIYGENKKGILAVRQLVNYEIERMDKFTNGRPIIKFKERITGNDFNVFEVAHFRLLADDKFLPYGSSVLSKIRRVFRQLCVDSNTNIWTPTGYIKIKDLKIGDEIYSYDYENKNLIITKVKNVFKTGEKERFKINTKHRELILTDDHPILTNNINRNYNYLNINEISNENLILPTIKNGLDSFKIKLDSKNYYVSLNKNGKIKASKIERKGIILKLKNLNCETTIKNLHGFLCGYNRNIKYDDYLKLIKEFKFNLNDIDLYYFNSRKKAIVNKNLEFTIDNNFIKLFGFMLGDGWINYYNNNVGFALGVYEDENEYYINLCKSLGEFNYNITDKQEKRGRQINFYSRELKTIFEKLEFKTGAFNKKIPKWVFSLSYENKINFIKGMFDADGCDNNGLYSSVNYNLINDLRNLAQTCNIKVGKILNDNRIKTTFFNKKIKRQKSYCLYLNFNNINNVDNHVEERILKKESIGIGEVWDLETESELHNFIANGVVVHNCLAEDAMLTYRIVRAGEKKVFKIDVGNIDDDDVEEYMFKVASNFKRAPQVDMNNGQFDYRYNILGVDEDYFLPVRNGNSVTGVDTLPGATNLSEIADIEYLRDNLFTGLSIPKPFLSFQDAAGGGKNMAQYDIRFAKKIMRIQQAMIQELNKIAMIHLYYLGFDKEDLGNFVLTLNNPSTQQELLKAQLLKEKAQTYSELTKSEQGGIAAMSHTEAKKLLFNKSDSDIVIDLKQQRMERALAQELQDSPLIIKKTGLFNDLDKKYGDEEALLNPPEPGSEETNQENLPQPGKGEFQTPAELPPVEGEGLKDKENILFEKKIKKYNTLVNQLIYNDENKDTKKIIKNKKIIEDIDLRNKKLNAEANSMINEIDKLLDNNNIIDIEIKDNDIV